MLKALFTFILLAASLTQPAWTEDLDSASKEALEKTQSLLKSKTERQKFIDKDEHAKAADKKIDALTPNPKIKEKMYNTSSDIFGDLVKQTGGDVTKMNDLLDNAMKNPEGFYNNLSEAQQKQIRDLANQIQNFSPQNSPQN